MTAYVKLQSVSKAFGNHEVLKNVSLDIPEGAFVTLLGPSGCGKTTLLRIIAGFYEPDGGEVWIDGRRVNGIPAHKRNTPMVFQDYALFPHMTVIENIAYGLKLRKVPKAEIEARCGRVLKLLGLGALRDRQPGQLSGGQQQRVALARALVLDPRIILMDEPLSNLDAKLRVSIRDEIRQIQRELNLTVINVTHDQEEAMAVSDLIAVMHEGVLQQAGSPTDIYFRPCNRFVADFIGMANPIEGKIKDHRNGLYEIETDLGVFYSKNSVDKLRKGQRCTIIVRPQSLRFAESDGLQNVLSAEIIRYTFMGSCIRYVLRAGHLEFVLDVKATAGEAPMRGVAKLTFSPNDSYLVPVDGALA